MDDQLKLKALSDRYLQNDLTPDELTEFLEMIARKENEEWALKQMGETWNEEVIPMRRSSQKWKRVVAIAASIVVVFGVAYWFNKSEPGRKIVARTTVQTIPDKVRLVAADGKIVPLDSLKP